MKLTKSIQTILFLTSAFFTVAALSAQTQEESEIHVSRMVVCESVENHEPVGEKSTFADTVSRIFCFTEIENARENTRVKHRWYYGETLKAEVTLPVYSASWRTFSSKRMLPSWTGEWRVDLLDEKGAVLKSVHFRLGEQISE